MIWEVFTNAFVCIGQCALALTLVCLLDRRIARRVAAFWAAYSESHRLFCESMATLSRSRLKELESTENEAAH